MKRVLAALRKAGRYFVLALLLLLLCFSAFLWYTTTESFQQIVRGRLITAIQNATGGRVELGSFHVVPLRLQVEIRDLTIHGRETSGAPYVHVDSVPATVNLSSALGARIGFRSLTLHHPVVHIVIYPDGSTNIPAPTQRGVDFARLFSISVDRLEVNRGELVWQNQVLPLDFRAENIGIGLDYSFLRRRYSGSLAVGRAETRFDGYRPAAWAGRTGFSIGESGIEINGLEIDSEKSHLQANGLISDFRHPVLKGKYKVALDVQRAGAIARRTELKGGKLEISGEGSWSAGTFGSTGTFDLVGFGGESRAFSIQAVSASGKFAVNPQKISISQVEGRALHGNFSSDTEITDWRSTSAAERGSIRLSAKNISLAELLQGLGQQLRPIKQLRLAGEVSGKGELQWKQSVKNTEAAFSVAVSRPAKLAPGQIPLSASSRGTYRVRSGELNLADLAATTPASQVRATGTMTASSGLNLSFSTSDLEEWQPIVSALFPAGAPFEVQGRASFNGSLRGKFPNVSLSGTVQAQDFDMLLPATAHSRATRYHWDSGSAEVQLSPRHLSLNNGVLSRGNESFKFDGSAELAAWKLPPNGGFQLQIEARNVDAAEITKVMNARYQVSGTLDGTMRLSGTRSLPKGEGTFTITRGSIQEQKFDRASAVLGISGTETALKDMRITRGNASVRGDGTYDLATRAFRFNLKGEGFNLSEVAVLEKSRIKVAGKLDFSAQASGTMERPEVRANLQLRDVLVNEDALGDMQLELESQGQDLRVTGRSNFKNAELYIDGDVQLREQWPARIDFRFTHLDIDSFLESYLHGHVTGHSAVAGAVQVLGPLRNPREMSVIGNLTDVQAELEKIKLHNQGPVHFEVNNRAVRIETLHIAGDNTDFTGGGSMQLAGDRALNFAGQGKADLKLIATYDPDFSASGTVTGEVTVSGSVDAPLVRGKLKVEDGAISDINLPSALSDINGTLNFNQRQVTIESLTAKTGGGTIAFAGHAELAGKQVNFDLTASANAVRLRYPPGVSSTANAELHWSGSSAGSTLSGDVTVIKLGATPGFDFGAYLQRAAQVSSLPQTDPVLNKIRLDLHLVTAPELQMQTSVIRLQGDADLRIRGNAAKPVILGRADILEGEAYFNGTKYRLERGGVMFNNPAVTTPFLDLEATTRVRDYEVTLSMTGEMDKPKINYRSEPPLPTADIIALLAFGQTTEQSAQLQQTSQSAFNQQASNAMLAAALNATLSNRTQRLFGVSRIKIDPQGLTTETSPTQSGPAVTIEQQVKDNLTVTYTTNVSQASQQIIRAEYNVSKNVSVVAIRDQNGVVSFDVKIRRRKR